MNNDRTSTPIICLMGPTGSGKTATVLQLAEQRHIGVISVDSALIYRGMDIGTAKPTRAELQRVPHYLVDIKDPEETYSAAEFVRDCEAAIAKIISQERQPILVGGTMLYFKALQQGLSDLPPADATLRESLQRRLNTEGLAALYTELKRVDPDIPIHAHDTQRILRALEVYALTQQPLSGQQCARPTSAYSFYNIGILPPDRVLLHARLNQRFLQMRAEGLEDEVRALQQRPGLDLQKPSIRTVGYRQTWEYLQGLCDEKTYVERACAATRQLAKRQLTWLRSWPALHGVNSAEEALGILLEKIV